MLARAGFEAARAAAAVVALPALLATALAERSATRRRRRAGARPRLVYGPTPIISLKYMSEAMRQRGYETTTFVYGVATINERSDFDASLDDTFGGRRGRVAANARELLAPYLVFARLLRRADVFHFFFDGGFLRSTPLRFLELQLLHAAGKKAVVMPYGGDVAVPSQLRSERWRRAFDLDYPELRGRESETLRWIRHCSRRADFVVACLVHFETLPRRDLLTTHYYPIDTDAWRPGEEPSDDGVVRVFHAANHRALKGTDAVVRACRELAEEGVPVELVLAEGLPNAEVRRLLAACDLVAEQFVLGYALAAMEAMALAKPVLSNLSEPGYYDEFRSSTGLDECPIVDTPPERLKEAIRRLAADAALRRELGEAGRRYVLEFHGYEPVGRMWELVYRTVWHGEPLPTATWHPRREGNAGADPVALEAGAR